MMNYKIIMVAINTLATGTLFALTKGDAEPFIAPLSEVSMALRWLIISAVIAFLQFMLTRGIKRYRRGRTVVGKMDASGF